MTTTQRPARLGPFNLGMNNRAPDTAMRVRSGSYLRSAVNADVTSEGRLRRRPGSTKVLAGSNMHSLFAGAGHAYVVADGALNLLVDVGGEMQLTPLLQGLLPHARVDYCTSEDEVLCTDGQTNYVLAGASIRPLSVPTPNPAPALEAAAGDLPAGLYQAVAVFVAADGRRSGTSPIAHAQVEAGQGVAVTGLPTAFPPGVTAWELYLTSPDGQIFMLAAKLSAPAAPGASLPHLFADGLSGVCPTFMLAPMPAGEIVRVSPSGSRLLVARGKILYFSQPFSFGLHNPLSDYVAFNAPITNVEVSASTIYVATTDTTYRMAGDIAGAAVENVLPYGGVPGTGGSIADRSACWWMSTRGVVIFNGSDLRSADSLAPGESAVNLQADAVAVDRYAHGASVLREQNGSKQLISAVFNAEKTGAAAYSFFDAEIVRKGTTV